jgi:hypothetical protein
MGCKIIGDLHAGVATAHHEHPLASIPSSRLVGRGVDSLPGEALHPGDLRDAPHGVLAGGHDQEPRRVPDHRAGRRVARGDDPPAGALVVRRRLDRRAVPGLDAEALGVGVEVRDELPLGDVGRGAVRERRVRQRAELLGEVELEAVVGAAAPQRRAAALALDDDVGHGAPAEARRRGHPRRTGADDQRNHLLLHSRRTLDVQDRICWGERGGVR